MKNTTIITILVFIATFFIPLFALSLPLFGEFDTTSQSVAFDGYFKDIEGYNAKTLDYDGKDNNLSTQIEKEISVAKTDESATSSSISVINEHSKIASQLSLIINDNNEYDKNLKVRVKMGEKIVTMKLDDYLIGVLAGEMPASFPIEALKAQAVAARTFTIYRINNQQIKHPDAHVCTNYRCCKAYLDIEKINWGNNETLYKALFKQAVNDTDGVIVTYEQEAIMAVFHSSAGGRTENSKDVWGGDVPYLKSVQSPDSEFVKTAEYSLESCKKMLQNSWKSMNLNKSAESWFGNSVRTEGGNVKKITIGGVTVSGSNIRNVFGLHSANFDIKVSGKTVIFTSYGYGHGVGLSQYGAKAFAEQGKTFDEIVLWYYSDTKIEQLEG